MKIKPEHYTQLRNNMAIVATIIPAHAEKIKDDPRIKDFSKRLRWDTMYLSGSNAFICQELYKYMNDTHIDTALKAIMVELGLDSLSKRVIVKAC